MLYAPDAAQMCQFEFTCTCVKDLHGILGHQGFRCVRAMRRSLCSNIFQTPMLTTGELFTMLDALFFAMFDSRKACQQFTWGEDSVLSHAVCWMGCNGLPKRLAANARAALTIHYPFRHSCFWSALPWSSTTHGELGNRCLYLGPPWRLFLRALSGKVRGDFNGHHIHLWKMLRDLSVHVGKGWKFNEESHWFGSILNTIEYYIVGRNRATVSTWKYDKHGSCSLPYNTVTKMYTYTVYECIWCNALSTRCVLFVALFDRSLVYHSALCTMTILRYFIQMTNTMSQGLDNVSRGH